MTITTVIAAVPDSPSRADPVNFDDRAEDMLERLETLDDELNAWAQEANQLQVEINQSESNVSDDRLLAVNAAATAIQKASEASGYKDSVTVMAAAVQSAAGLPSLTGNAQKRLGVNAAGNGVEWIGGFALPAYINAAVQGNVDLDFTAATVFELSMVGNAVINATNLPTGAERAVAYLNGTNLGGYGLTSNIDFTGVSLLSGFSVSQISKTGRTFTPATAAGTELSAVRFSNDGTKLITLGRGSSSAAVLTVHNCNHGLDALTVNSSKTLDNSFTKLDSFAISDDGTTLVVRRWTANEVQYWNFATPWNAATLTKTGTIAGSVFGAIGYATAIAFSYGGDRFYASDSQSNLLWWDLSTPWDISGISAPADGSTQLATNYMALGSLTVLADNKGVVVTNQYNDDSSGRRLEKWEFPTVGNPVGSTLAEASPSLYADMNVPDCCGFVNNGSRVVAFGNNTTLHEYDIPVTQIITLHQVGNSVIARGA